MDNPNDVVTKHISIEYGLDGQNSKPFWAARFDDLVEGGKIDMITGLGLLCCAAIDLAQQHGMIPLPDEEDE